MRLTIELPPETERKLHARAAEAGQSVECVALQIIEEALDVGGKNPSHTRENL
jgi:plasmid stability protein